MGKNEKSEGQAYAGAPENGWPNQQQGQQPGAQTGQPGGPQPGVMYQFVPGAGFVPVNCQPGQWGCPPYGYMGYGPQSGPQPGYQQAPPGYGPQPGPYGNPYAGYAGHEGHEAHEAHHAHGPYGPQGPDMGQMYGMVGDVMKGKGDPGKLLGLLQAPRRRVLEGRAGRRRRGAAVQLRRGEGRPGRAFRGHGRAAGGRWLRRFRCSGLG